MTHPVKDKSRLLVGVSLAVMATVIPAQIAHAQAASAPPASAAAQPVEAAVEEVVVTGSRLKTGFQTPTPVTVASAEQLKAAAPNNLADGLNQLPAFAGSTKTSNPSTTNIGATTGQNLLNLRGLGPTRNLILLDGRRMPATNGSGSVDINVIPQGLVSRVDVVTGGASAAYGSDAVAGVVNFILDTGFEGFKGEVQTGTSTHQDLNSFGATVNFGKSALDGRARFIGSADYFRQDGLRANEKTHRDWFDNAAGRIPNPVAGARPSNLVIPNIRSSVGTFGGLISAGPLRGTQFLAGGVPAPFTYGPISGTTFASGGDGARANVGLMPDQLRYSTFAHGEFDLNEHATLFVEGLYAYSHTKQGAFYSTNTGAAAQYTIFRDNAYLPAEILRRMIAANIQSFTLGRYEGELPLVENESLGDVKRIAFGTKGAIVGNWSYDLSYSFGRSVQELRQNHLTINRPLYASADAVRDPATGRIVCRSTLQGLDPGCVPRNLFGPGAPDGAVTAYVTGDNVQVLTLDQTVVQANVNGDLGDKLSFGAGPISVATGVEYRKETAKQTVDALSPTVTDFTGIRGGPTPLQGRVGPYRFFNPLPLAGEYDIKEGYFEVAAPLLKDRPFIRSLEINGAMRRAKYSQSGGVTTWKYGANYEPTQDLRFRLTRSQDIRGPNVLELFNSASQTNNNQIYKGVTTQVLTIFSGNPNLKPEVAKTTTYGVVYRPGWLPGFQVSLDRYKIGISDAIVSLTSQRIIDECAAGNPTFCSQITVTSAGTLIIRTQNLNLAAQKTAGYDIEAAYNRNVWNGDLSVRLVANRSTEDFTQAPGSTPVQALGGAISPKWRGVLQMRYAKDNWSLFLQERYVHKALLDPMLVDGVDINDNKLPRIVYTNLGGTWSLDALGGRQELFFAVSNLFDQKPPVSPNNVSTFAGQASSAYDPIGRYFNVGFRFRY